MIAGTPLAFANVMPEGNILIIGASGTGIQELCRAVRWQRFTRLALAGATSAWSRRHQCADGTGNAQCRREKRSAGICSKTACRSCASEILNAMKATGKPTVALFLGYTPAVARDENVWFASSLDEATPGLPAFTCHGAN